MQDSHRNAMMFFELSDSRCEFRSNYDDSMADSIFPMPLINASPMSDLSYDLPSGSNSDDFTDVDYYDGMMDDMLMPHYLKYDIEKQPQLLNLVSPNDILPVETPTSLDSLNGAFMRNEFDDKLFLDDPLDIDSDGSSVLPESLEQMCGVTDQFLSDKVFNEMNNSGTDLDTMLEEDILPSITQSDSDDDSSIMEETPKNAEQDYLSSGTMGPDYKVDDDHCYYKLSEVKDKDDKEMRFLDMNDVWVSIGSPDSSGSSSEEVDVVTVTEELQAPFVPKVQATYRNKRQKRGLKSQKTKKNRSPSLSSKTFNAAIKRNMKRITSIRRTHRRKINNSVETTPSNSLPSSAPSSRCSSDGEDAGKRANHNSSERKRREVLRSNLQHLRLNVPSVQNNPKAPKVIILNSATKCVRDLEVEENKFHILKKNLKKRQNSLRTKLRNLQSEITESNRQFWQEMWLPSSQL